MSPEASLLSDTKLQNPFITTIWTSVDKLGKSVLDLILPLRCAGCDKVGFWICPDCLSQLKLVEEFACAVCGRPAIKGFTHPRCRSRYSLDRLISIYQFRGPLREAIHLLKYRRVTGLAQVLADLVAGEVESLGLDFGTEAVVVPVPLHWLKSLKRQFNQAELLADGLGKHLDLQVRSDILRRRRNTESQTELKRDERRQNVAGAFKVFTVKEKEVKDRDFLVIDDVCTTGATLNSCANALKRVGARYVWGLTVAKD
jgi:ComF family protein